MTLEVVHWHEKTGAGIWRQIYAYGADFWSRFLERVSGALRRRRIAGRELFRVDGGRVTNNDSVETRHLVRQTVLESRYVTQWSIISHATFS